MFTGIVQGIASVQALADQPGLRSFTLRFPPGFGAGLAVGASVAVDGVCLCLLYPSAAADARDRLVRAEESADAYLEGLAG